MNEPAVDLKSSLAQALHELLSSPRCPEEFLRDVSELSASSAESPWETLALLDQSFRQGKLSADLFRAARTRIERRALGLQEPVAVPERLGGKESLAIVSSALVAVVARSEPAPAATTLAEHEAELAALRVELEQARKQAAMYLERLTAAESRTKAAESAPAPAPAPPAKYEAELAALRVELEQARRQAALYRERLTAAEWRTKVAESTPAPAPAPLAKYEAELAALRVELEQARKQSALYRERLTASESRANAALLGVGAHLQREDRLNVDAGNHPWFTVSARPVALLAVLTGIVVLSLTVNRSSTSYLPRTAPVRTATVAAAIAPPPTTPGQLSLAAERYIVLPGQTQATIAVERTGGTTGTVSIRYWTVDLGARIGRDFLPRGGGTVTIPDGQDNAQITISILPARERRHIELFDLRIGKPGGGASLGKTVRTTVFLLPR